jgi:hypothetical protein
LHGIAACPIHLNPLFQQKIEINRIVCETRYIYFHSTDLQENAQKYISFIFFLMKNLAIQKKKIALPTVNKDY